MNTASVRETEFMTRSIARWGSLAVAIIFGVAFVTDKSLSWKFLMDQFGHVLLTLTLFAGYVVAWTRRYEVHGSIIAILATLGLYFYELTLNSVWTQSILLVVGLPAVCHLVAVMIHRSVLRRRKKKATP